jgi:signal transduction histidine kinase
MTPDRKPSFLFLAPHANELFEFSNQDRETDPSLPMSLVVPEDIPGLMTDIEKSASQLSPFEWTGRMMCKQGSLKWILAKSTPRSEPDGGITWDGVFLDVTKDVLMKEQLDLERAKSAQSSKLAALGEIAAGVAHEIHNPLAIISGMNQLIEKNSDDPEKLKKRTQSIGKACDRIEKIVISLKKFARQDTKNLKSSHSISEIIEESIGLTSIKSKKNQTDLIVENSSTALILCSPIEIEQILINLISNAIDAIENLSDRWVKIQAFDNQSHVVVRVIDAGNGIPEAVAKKLFNPFFSTKDVGAGTGLGLSISLSIAKEHGGDITIVKDSPNTCFELTLPKAQLAEMSSPD